MSEAEDAVNQSSGASPLDSILQAPDQEAAATPAAAIDPQRVKDYLADLQSQQSLVGAFLRHRGVRRISVFIPRGLGRGNRRIGQFRRRRIAAWLK